MFLGGKRIEEAEWLELSAYFKRGCGCVGEEILFYPQKGKKKADKISRKGFSSAI